MARRQMTDAEISTEVGRRMREAAARFGTTSPAYKGAATAAARVKADPSAHRGWFSRQRSR